MPASQLKRLKASLRDQGITGPPKSKKQKKSQNGRSTSERIERSAALQQIRDSFNPFELRQASRPAKFASLSAKTATAAAANGGSGRYKQVLHRPGVSKSAGEEMRRATLLPEMQRRNKVGGLVDRRIGEGDADMTPEERAVQRFARERQRKGKGGALFDLEASDDEARGVGLTHGGRRLDELEADDFDDAVSAASEGEDDEELFQRKRPRSDVEDGGEEDVLETEVAEPERKRSRKEIMEEVMAKSKFHKYERQKAKEEDEEMREELDKGMTDVLALLRGQKPPPPPPAVKASGVGSSSDGPVMNADRQKLLDGMDRAKADKDYDSRLRQLALDTRAKPSERTKTDEEKAAEEAHRLKDLEENRMRRMRGEDVEEEEDEDEDEHPGQEAEADAVKRAVLGDEDNIDEAAAFGLPSSAIPPTQMESDEQLVLDDEDEFALDEDLIASGSDVDLTESEEGASDTDEEASDDETAAAEFAEEEDEFVKDILGEDPAKTGRSAASQPHANGANSTRLSYTYPCPRSHAELLDVIKALPVSELPTVIQRIRALHHPSLSASNKEAMLDFSAALVDHLAYMAEQKQPLAVMEQLIRHLHSLSRTYPFGIANAFRRHLKALHERGSPTAGDLLILAAIGSIYPTSDHFHQVVTPAITLIARHLSLTAPSNPDAHATGAFLVRLGLDYQRLSKRYIPECVRFTSRALAAKPSPAAEQQRAHLANLVAMAELWRDKSSFTQTFEPFVPVLRGLGARRELQTLGILLQTARLRLRPLELHHHRPLPIRGSVPKFEEGFNPDKHYDPDRERSQAAKLQKEYKRERKGALRELRKDANFVAREQLRDKKERDAAYERKYKRLVAEVQGQEGHESKEYEREKKARRRARG